MATIPDSIKATLDAGWTAAGGAEPTYYVGEDYSAYNPPPAGKDYIWIDTLSLHSIPDAVNDTYSNITHTINIRCNTLTSADRRKEIADEIARILNGTAITGVNLQKVTDRRILRPERMKGTHHEQLQVTMLELLVSSASAYGAGATGDFTVTGDVITSSVYSLEEALMLGSANAAWVPCSLVGWDPDDKGEYTNLGTWTNVDNTTCYLTFLNLLPTNKGSLKLYISGTRVSLADADVGDYMASVKLEGEGNYGQTLLNTDSSANTTAGLQTDTFAAIDCSSYPSTRVRIQTVNTNAGDLDIQYVQVQAYYDT